MFFMMFPFRATRCRLFASILQHDTPTRRAPFNSDFFEQSRKKVNKGIQFLSQAGIKTYCMIDEVGYAIC